MAVEVESLDIPEVKLVTAKKIGDERGYFSEVFNRHDFSEAGVCLDVVQDNQSYSKGVGTIRGLHFQTEPYAQDKLVRVVRGAIWDVAVDVRRDSPTFGQYVSATLSAENWKQLYVPVGFAHGFCTLEPDTEVIYKVSAPYSPEHDKGMLWNDADLAISWPDIVDESLMSGKDQKQPRLKDIEPPFTMVRPTA